MRNEKEIRERLTGFLEKYRIHGHKPHKDIEKLFSYNPQLAKELRIAIKTLQWILEEPINNEDRNTWDTIEPGDNAWVVSSLQDPPMYWGFGSWNKEIWAANRFAERAEAWGAAYKQGITKENAKVIQINVFL